jgi:hypothetical protein
MLNKKRYTLIRALLDQDNKKSLYRLRYKPFNVLMMVIDVLKSLMLVSNDA